VYVVLFDIDDFKKINDKRGHLCGDYVLRRIAEIVKGTLRPMDIVARYGGDEFAIMLHGGKSPRDALNVVERVRKSIGDFRFEFEKKRFQVSCSFGVTLVGNSDSDRPSSLELIFELVDRGLYASKRAGKNRITFVNPEHPPAETRVSS
jgi:diguanylate cyclase (GGDEF)-like protein